MAADSTDRAVVETGERILARLDKIARERRWLIVALVVGSVLLASGGLFAGMVLRQGQVQREAILAAVREIKDCTTPDVPSDCQRRITASRSQASALAALSADNLNASIAVGTCLRAQAPDVTSCARARFAELNKTSTQETQP